MLWLIGLGVGLGWTPPGQPQKNGTVERDNGVIQQWVETKTCRTRAELRARLEREARIRREVYPSVAGMSRMTIRAVASAWTSPPKPTGLSQ